MKNYIKSILALATAALMGSSAWAAVSFNPTSVTVNEGASATVTMSGTAPKGGTTDTFAITTPPASGTASASVSGKTLTIEGLKAGTTSVKITHTYSTSKSKTSTETGTLNITVKAVAVEKTVEVGKEITLDTGIALGGRYYYKLVGDGNATDYVTLNPASAIRPGSGQSATGDLKLTGKKATTSPVTVRLQTTGTTSSSDTYNDLKVYSVTVTEPAPIDGTVTKTIDVSKSVDVTTSVAVDSAKTQISPSGLATVTYSGDKKTMTIKGGSSENSGTIKFYDSNGALVLVVNLTVNDPSKLKLNVSEIETFVFPTGGATWGAKSSSQNITANGSTANNQYTLTIGSTQDKGAGSDQSGTVTVTSNNVTVLTINVTALKDNDWGESTHPDAPAVKKLTVYVGKSLVREYHIATKCAYGREETNPDSAITVAYNPVCESTFTVPTGFDSSMRKTSSTVNDFSMTITGSKIGTAGIKILYGGTNPARWAGNYTVEVRDVLTGTPTATGLDYGDTLSASTISGTMKDSKGTTVSGTWAWVNPSTVPAAGKNKYPAKFTATGTNAQYYDEYDCEIEVTVTNPLTPVAVPTANNLTYNGNEQTGVAAGTGYTLTGTTKATDAGNYTAYATPASGYCWKDDGTTDQKTINWSIARARSAVEPTKATGLTYNGAEQFGYTAAGANVTLDGTTSATNVNNYTFTATPTANYAWSDGTFAAKTYNWSIGYKQATVTVVSTNKLSGAAEPIYRTTTTGFVAGDTTELTWTAFRTNASETVGTYDVVVVGEEQQGGYQITYNKGTLTIKNGVVTVNGKAYLDVAAAFADLKASGGQAVFNEAVTDYNGYAFAKDTTIDYDKDTGACRVTGEMTAPQVKAEEDIAVNGTLTLTGDISVGATGASRTLVAATNVVLGADVTVGKESEGATDAIAVLTFEEINVGAFKLTLTTNGVVRSAAKLTVADIFEESDKIKETQVDGWYEYVYLPVTYIDVPTAKDLTYDGTEQTGVEEVEGYTLDGDVSATDAGDNYTAIATLKDGYCWSDGSLDPTNINWTIKPMPVTVFAIATNKVYGAADPTIEYTVEPELVSGDKLEGALERSEGEDVDVYDVKIGTLANSNYKITLDEDSTFETFAITAKPLTIKNMTATSKTYDGTTDAVITGGELEGVVGDDDVTATMPTAGTFASADVGTGIAVTIELPELEGSDKGNYTLTEQPTLTADITKSPANPFDDKDDPEGPGYTPKADPNDWDSLTNEVAYSAFDCMTNYDGEAHAILTNELVAAYEAACYATPTITYSSNTNNANEWAADPIALVDVGATSVWYKVSVKNYEDVIRVAKVVVGPRKITVTPVAGQTKAKGKDYTIAYETNGVMVAGDVFTGALAAASDEAGDQEILIGTLAIDDGNGGKNYDLVFTEGVTIKVKSYIAVDVPTAKGPFTYDGTEKTGVEEGTGYTLTDNAKTDAGDYTAVAVLADGYCWSDDSSTTNKSFAWSIAQATITIAANTVTVATNTAEEVVTAMFSTTTNGTLVAGNAIDYAVGWKSGFVYDDVKDVLGTNEDVIVVTGEADQGNYAVTFESADLEMIAKQPVAPGEKVVVSVDLGDDPTEEEIEQAAKDAVVPDIKDPDAVAAGQANVVKPVGTYDKETKTLEVSLAIDTNKVADVNETLPDVSSNLVAAVEEEKKVTIKAAEATPGVYYSLVYVDPEGDESEALPRVLAKGGDVELPVPEEAEEAKEAKTGYYRVEQHLTKEDAAEEGVVSKEIGLLQKENEKKRTAISVPWTSLANGGAIALENFIVTKNLDEDTKLYAYDKSKSRYNAWNLKGDKTWEAIKTVKIEDGVISDEPGDQTASMTLACGSAAWIEFPGAVKKVTFVGGVPTEKKVAPVESGWNLVSMPDLGDFDFADDKFTTPPVAGDQIVVPTANGPQTFTYKGSGKWGYIFQKKVTIGNKTGFKTVTGTIVNGVSSDDVKIPAGTGFWLIDNNSGTNE